MTPSTLMSIEQFVKQLIGDRVTIGPDDGLILNTQNGAAIVTYTDNRTNDPSIVVSPAVERR